MPNIGTKEEQQMYEMLQDLWGRTESVDDVFDEVSGYMNGMRSAQSGNEALREAGREVLGSLAPLRLGGMPLDSRMYEAVSRLETLLAAHDRGEK